VAKWRRAGVESQWFPKRAEKVPTKIAYEPQSNDGPLIAWAAIAKKCRRRTSKNASRHGSGRPPSPTPLLLCHGIRPPSEYLHAFCANIICAIDKSAACNFGWRDGTVIWSFTVPGSWATLPVVADFKRLVKDAVSPCFQRNTTLRICIEATEAMASAQWLLEEASAIKGKEYAIGNVVISCDIGGATTDVATSVGPGPGRLTTWPQLNDESVGTVTIQKAFWLHAKHTLRRAGAQNPHQLALEMARRREFMEKAAEFTAGESDVAIYFEIPSGHTFQQSPSLETPTPRESIVYKGRLYIHR
jgi:hypothetical protein